MAYKSVKDLDAIDIKIIERLCKDSSASLADIAALPEPIRRRASRRRRSGNAFMSAPRAKSIDELKRIANRMRIDIVRMIGAAGSGALEELVVVRVSAPHDRAEGVTRVLCRLRSSISAAASTGVMRSLRTTPPDARRHDRPGSSSVCCCAPWSAVRELAY